MTVRRARHNDTGNGALGWRESLWVRRPRRLPVQRASGIPRGVVVRRPGTTGLSSYPCSAASCVQRARLSGERDGRVLSAKARPLLACNGGIHAYLRPPREKPYLRYPEPEFHVHNPELRQCGQGKRAEGAGTACARGPGRVCASGGLHGGARCMNPASRVGGVCPGYGTVRPDHGRQARPRKARGGR